MNLNSPLQWGEIISEVAMQFSWAIIFTSFLFNFCSCSIFRGVVPRGAGGAMALPDFGRSVNPVSTRGADYGQHASI